MKSNTQSIMYKLCTLCIALSGICYWDRMSFLFFGEAKYPSRTES